MLRVLVIRLVNILAGSRFFRIKVALLNCVEGWDINKSARIHGRLYISRLSELQIGTNTWIGPGFEIHGNGNVIIGDNCDIAPKVTILTGSHKIGGKARRAGLGYNTEVLIGSATWIGANSTIGPGVNIQDGCIIGMGTVVYSSLKENMISLDSSNNTQFIREENE